MNETKELNQYLLSTYAVEGQVPGAPKTPAEMQAFMERVMTLESEMDASGAFVFGGALVDAEMATIIQVSDGDVVSTNGPTVQAKEQIAGFYIINAEDLEAAQVWGSKVADATNHPIEVRPFRATGRVGA